MGFTQKSLGAHSNPISFLWDSHKYPWTHTATRSLFFGIHTDFPGRTQQPDLFFLFVCFFWDSHRYPWAHTATRSLFFGIHTDIPGRTQQPNLSLFFFFFRDSHRYPWAHTATRSLFLGIHTDIPGRTQQPNLFFLFFFLGFTQISLGAHSNPISLFFFLFSGFTQISLGAHSNPISFLRDSHRYPWAHTATQSLFFSFFLGGDSHRYPWAHTATRSHFFGIHTDIPGRTQQPNLSFFFFFLFSGFTQISLGAHSNPISFLWDSHRYPWAHTATQSLFFSFFWDSHRYPWAHTATRSLFFGIHTHIPGRTQQPDLFSLGFTQISLGAHSNPIYLFFFFFRDSHRYPWAHTANRSLFFGIHTDIPGRTQQPDLFSLGFTQISLGAHSNPSCSRWDSHRYSRAHTATQALLVGIHTDIPGLTQKPYHKKAH